MVPICSGSRCFNISQKSWILISRTLQTAHVFAKKTPSLRHQQQKNLAFTCPAPTKILLAQKKCSGFSLGGKNRLSHSQTHNFGTWGPRALTGDQLRTIAGMTIPGTEGFTGVAPVPRAVPVPRFAMDQMHKLGRCTPCRFFAFKDDGCHKGDLCSSVFFVTKKKEAKANKSEKKNKKTQWHHGGAFWRKMDGVFFGMGMLEAMKLRLLNLEKPGFHGQCIFCIFMSHKFLLFRWLGPGFGWIFLQKTPSGQRPRFLID